MAASDHVVGSRSQGYRRDSAVQDRERHLLACYAMHSRDSQGRVHTEDDHPFRGPFQRDRDRILHSGAFRRLSDKTQVFTGQSEYHRTRLTHTMEVASIARTMGRALRLNEDLIEALALLHDIGHPPFGHAGEDVLDQLLSDEGGFSHNQFALTIVEQIEQRYPEFAGLNLTHEVLCGQRRRVDKSAQLTVAPLEVQVVDLADSITYNAHDVDDAVELGWLELRELLELPILATCYRQVTGRHGRIEGPVLRRAIVHEMINLQVEDVIQAAQGLLQAWEGASAQDVRQAQVRLRATDWIRTEKHNLERYLYARLYRHRDLVRARTAAQAKIRELAQAFLQDPGKLPPFFGNRAQTHGLRRSIVDCIATMTDQSFLREYQRLTA